MDARLALRPTARETGGSRPMVAGYRGRQGVKDRGIQRDFHPEENKDLGSQPPNGWRAERE